MVELLREGSRGEEVRRLQRNLNAALANQVVILDGKNILPLEMGTAYSANAPRLPKTAGGISIHPPGLESFLKHKPTKIGSTSTPEFWLFGSKMDFFHSHALFTFVAYLSVRHSYAIQMWDETFPSYPSF